MELQDLKLLVAGSLLGGSVKTRDTGIRGKGVDSVSAPNDAEIAKAVSTAQRIWEEVLRQERES
jgi:hypothetical protein